MAGDSRNPKISLLKKYDIPIDHICYEYVEKCADKKELERIVRILRSGEEGFYPDLLKVTEDRLRLFAPDSRVLRVETAILTKESLPKEEWKAVENELLSWEEEMKVVDKTLDFEKSRIDVVGNKNMPSVRKIVQPKAKTIVNEKKCIRNNANERIKSGDYAAWDKFDVDKELLKIEIEEERKEEQNKKKKREINKVVTEKKIEIDIDKDSYSSMEQEVLASQAKDRGNECYKSGDWNNALKYYELSIKLHPTPNAHNNRAMTYLKLKEYENAVNDCNIVLNKEENNVKALHRRATAYQCMEDNSNKFNKLALQDLNKIVLLEPNNKIAQLDLQKLKKKLGIEDVGKKFRMTILESESVLNKTDNFAKEERSLPNVKDAPKNVDKLPLTYYGPSTSTFQCEPYSMAHRALTGSLLLPEVVCKCNSNRPRQNPLCQKCGEAMSAPKSTTKLKNAISNKANNEVKNMQKIESIKIDNFKNGSTLESTAKEVENSKKNKQICNEASAALGGTTCSNVEEFRDKPKEIGTSVSAQIIESKDVVKPKINNAAEEKCRLSNSDLEKTAIKNSNILSSEVEKLNKTKAEVLKPDKPEDALGLKNAKKINTPDRDSSTACNIKKNKTCELKICSDFSQMETKHSSGKTKSKKKKSKESNKESKVRRELELIEPVKVVHAAKYLHPTSVEPKVRTETSKKIEPEINFGTNNKFKAFVPNRQCLSVQREENLSETYVKSFTKKVAQESVDSTTVEINDNLPLECNKENYLKNTNSNVGENLIFNSEIKKEMVDSAYKFVKTWEELKKMDPSYVKRAEIIRLIRPADLGKGIKLDSDMLSSLLECLEKHFVETDPKVVVDFLKQLPQVPRFGLIKMFLADEDKKKMKNLISAAENKGFTLEEEVKKALAIIS